MHIIIIIEVLLTLLLIQIVSLLLLELLLVVIVHHQLLLLLLLWVIVIISLLLGKLVLILHKLLLWILLHIIVVLRIIDIVEILRRLLLLIDLSKIHIIILPHHILHILNDIWVLDGIGILKSCCLEVEIVVVALGLELHGRGSHVHWLEVLEVHVLHILHILQILHVLVHVIHINWLLTHKVLRPRLLVGCFGCDGRGCLILSSGATILLNSKSNDVNRDLSLLLLLLSLLLLRASCS